jgi:mono/diheme cytochrome c family protein
MQIRRLVALAIAAAGAVLAAGCGGGGGSPGDIRPSSPPDAPVTNPNSFLLFPNPQVQADGSLQTDTAAYTNAYYGAIDPNNERSTFEKWKAVNRFDSGTGEQVTVVFGDTRDLGYGRRMTGRRNPDGTVAFFVENYLVTAAAGYTYNSLSLDASVVRDPKWFLGINAIEFSPGPNGGPSFPKWYNFNPVTGQRNTLVDLDGRGDKAMPGPCITCHGGRGDALPPLQAGGKQPFNLVQNSASQARGDVQGHLHAFEADTFDFSTKPGFTRDEQEAAIKKLNTWVLCTYPLAAPSAHPEDACRRQANVSEWQGTAAAEIKAAYGGDGLPSPKFADTYVPQSWVTAGQSTLYREVIVTSCRACHTMRGSGGNSDIDFTNYDKFVTYAERIKSHVFERGNMPLAKIVFEAFWGSANRPKLLADFLLQQGINVRDSTGQIRQPGFPVALVGPDRVTRPGATVLSGTTSLYASGYEWTIVSGPAGATLSNATAPQATLNAAADGTYVIQLVTSNGAAKSAPAQLKVVVDSTLPYAPTAVRFADIKAMLQTTGCTACHSPTGTLPRPPLFYTNEDRNGDGIAGDAADDAWFYTEVRGRVNFTDIVASPILRKPSGNHHGGLLQPGFDTSAPAGSPLRARYDLVLNWILAGAPQ